MPDNLLFVVGAGLLAGYFPILQVNGRAGDVKKQVGREVPEIAALVAAELAAGNAPDVAIERAAQMPGPLGKLLGQRAGRFALERPAALHPQADPRNAGRSCCSPRGSPSSPPSAPSSTWWPPRACPARR